MSHAQDDHLPMTRKARTAQPKGRAKAKNIPTGVRKQAAERMERFALAYHAHPNAQQAAAASGYSVKTAASQGSRLLTIPKVQDRLRELAAAAASARIATSTERQEFLTLVLRGEVQDNQLFFGEVVKVPSSVQNRLKAAEQLSKMQGSFVERREITGKDGAPIQTESTNALPEDQRADRLLSLLAKAAARKDDAPGD